MIQETEEMMTPNKWLRLQKQVCFKNGQMYFFLFLVTSILIM